MITLAHSSTWRVVPTAREETALISAPCLHVMHYTTACRGCAALQVLSAPSVFVVASRHSSSLPQTKRHGLSSFDAQPTSIFILLSPHLAEEGGQARGWVGTSQPAKVNPPHTSTHFYSFSKWAFANLLGTVCSPGYKDSGQLGIRDGSCRTGAFVPHVPKGSAWPQLGAMHVAACHHLEISQVCPSSETSPGMEIAGSIPHPAEGGSSQKSWIIISVSVALLSHCCFSAVFSSFCSLFF